MVAGDQQDRHLHIAHQALQHLVQQIDGLRRRQGPVVYVAGHDHGIHAGVFGHAKQFFQHNLLVVQQRLAVERPSQVPVRSMKNPHVFLLDLSS